MTGQPLHTADAEISAARSRLAAHATRSEHVAAAVLLAASCAGSVALLVSAGAGTGWIAAFAVLAGLYAVAGLVAFEVGTVHTDCSLAALAAMLVALPPAVLPWCAALGVGAGAAFNVARGARHRSRVSLAVAQVSLPVLAPAVVLALLPPVSSWNDLPAIACALVAYVTADLVISRVFAWLAYAEPLAVPSFADAWVYGVDLLLAPLGVAIAVAANGREWALAIAFLPLTVLMQVFAAERRSRIDQALELSRAYRGTAMLLGDVVETDDAYTGSHSRDVVELAVEVGRRMGLGANALRTLEFGALLHDVGKIAVPKAIIHKPGKLTADEWEIMKRHTIEGQRMLENVGGVLAEVGVIVRASHEDYDGRGYPDGLVGEDIPIESRICSACDAFSAMTTDRSYRAAMPPADAIAELRRCAGTQFDPRVVSVLVSVLAEDAVERVETAAPALLASAGG